MSEEEKKDQEDKKAAAAKDTAKPASTEKNKEEKPASENKKSSEKKNSKKDGASRKKKSDKMSAGIDPKLAAKFKEKSQELKERIHKEQLEEKIRQHTISPMKAVVPAIVAILLVIICISYFSSKAEDMLDGVNPATAPRITAEGVKAEKLEDPALPIELQQVENSFFCDAPDDQLIAGAHDAVKEQMKAVEEFKLPVEVKNEIGMKFRLIPPGKFIMGSPEKEEYREEDEYQHLSIIKAPFYIGKTEVTVAEWEKVMGHLPTNSVQEPNMPVTGVSLNDALIFVQQLNRSLTKEAGFKYYIISEPEWEYACRAGTEAPYYFGHHILINDYVTYKSSTTTHNVEPVASKLPNAWGLYDMLGNAMEWTRTPYFMYACGENQYAGINAAAASAADKDIREFSWDTPIYDGEHPENLVDPFDKFDVPTRAFETNLDICYHDINNNKKYDNHEPIWKDSLGAGKVGYYDPGIDVVILTYAKEIPAGTKGEKEGLYYHDKDLSTEWNPGEGIWSRNDSNRKYNNNYTMRGGTYFYDIDNLRSASRFNLPRQNAPTYTGVRLVIYLDKFLKK